MKQFLILVFLLLAISNCAHQEKNIYENIDESIEKAGIFSIDFYSIPHEKDFDFCTKKQKIKLKNYFNEKIARVCPSFKKQLDLFGQGRLKRKITILVIGHTWRDGKKVAQYSKDISVHGTGAKDQSLYPFVSVISNPKSFKIGTVLYIPASKKFSLSARQKHPGFFWVHKHDKSLPLNKLLLVVPSRIQVRQFLNNKEIVYKITDENLQDAAFIKSFR